MPMQFGESRTGRKDKIGGMTCWEGCRGYIASAELAKGGNWELIFQILKKVTELDLTNYWRVKGKTRPPDQEVHSNEGVGLGVEDWLHAQTALAVVKNIRVDRVWQARKEKYSAPSIKLKSAGNHQA